mmetsp:Transcript_61823/g.149675  ORF Transcript_61823/g.149675 Transcript_61823/m.149675 type:complete len:134 (+) Transcript_61823:74-475(+)
MAPAEEAEKTTEEKTTEEKPAEEKPAEAAAESTPGVMDMKVTTKKSVGFYIRSAKSFLTGIEGADGEKKEPVCVLNISGLGEAINAAVAAAAAVESEGLGTIKKIETSYPEMASGGSARGCPRINITVYHKGS